MIAKTFLRTRPGAVMTALVAWVAIPLPGVFEVVLFSLWPRKSKTVS